MSARGKTGMVGIFTGTLGSYGSDHASVVHNVWCDVAESTNSANIWTDKQTASGFEEGTKVVKALETTELSLSGNVTDTAYPIFVGLALGADIRAASGGTVYRLEQSPVATALDLPATSISVGVQDASPTANLNVEHLGCVVNTLSLSGSVGGPWKFSAAIPTSGAVGTIQSISGTTPVVPYFPFSSTTLFSGDDGDVVIADVGTNVTNSNTAPAGACIVTPQSHATTLQSFQWTINNNVETTMGHVNSSSGYATSMPRGNRVQSLSMSMLWDDSVAQTFRTGVGVVKCFELTVRTNVPLAGDATYFHAFKLVFPRAVLVSAKMGGGLGVKTIETVWDVIQAATGNSVYSYSWGDIAIPSGGGIIN
jgi:hypothetical protein